MNRKLQVVLEFVTVLTMAAGILAVLYLVARTIVKLLLMLAA